MAEPKLLTSEGREELRDLYRSTLLDDVIPFWLRHGLDPVHGGLFTALDEDGSCLDTDKSIWFQGRGGWMFSTLYNSLERRPEWLEAAQSCALFSQKFGHSLDHKDGKMFFTVTREGLPLRMRRYVYSESFAAISYAGISVATGNRAWATMARQTFATYLKHSFQPGVAPAKYEETRPTKGLGPLMIGIITAQELRALLGDVIILEQSLSQWIEDFICDIERDFLKPSHQALMEQVGLEGEIIEHLDGRTLNPGHALECAWFIMHEGRLKERPEWIRLGTTILDWMWVRGWDKTHGGLLYFTDLHGKPVQEYWHDMKFWWPHNEAIIATLMAWKLTGERRYAQWHQDVHDWAFSHFPDPIHGEWYGYLHRDGSVSQRAKGNMFKGPFHLPRMLWLCSQELA